MRKVLSFVLVLALVLGSFSFAFGLSDIDDSANSDAITVANDLGIITGFPDGTFKPDQAVNRAEFAAMITRALGVPESALAGFTATSFKDTSGYTWAVKYLAFCESKGIMLGDGMGNAMPGRTISLNEAITMVLRAVGYTENSAVLVGVWPSNYVTLAQDLDLYADVASMVTVDRANAAQVLYNALTVQKVQVDADGATTGITSGGNPVTMLTSGLSCSETNKGDAYVLTTTDADTAVLNAYKFVGAFVKTFENSDGEIVAVEEVSTFLTGKYYAADGVFKAGGVEYNLASPGALDYDWENANVATNSSPTAIANGQSGAFTKTLNAGTTYTIAANVSGKTIKEVYSIATWTSETSFEYEADMLEDDNINGYDFTLDDNDEIDMGKFTLLGVDSLSEINEDDVVTVYLATPGNSATDIVKLAVSSEKVEGTVTKVSGTDYTLAGKVYELSANPAPTVALGDSGTASLDYNGKIAFWDVDDASVANYAVFITTDKAVSFGDTTVKVKLFNKEGEEVTPVCKDAVTGAAMALDTIVRTAVTGGITNGAIVEYDLDSNGKVKTLTSSATITTLAGTTSKDGSLIGTTVVDKNVVVFLYNATDSEWEMGSVASFDTTVDFNTVTHTAIVDSGKIKAIAALKGDIVDQSGNSYGVINATSAALDANSDDFLALEGFMDGAAFDSLTDETNTALGWTTTTKAGITQFTVNSDGVITDFTSGAGITSEDFVSEAATGVASSVASISGNQVKLVDGKVYLAASGAVVYLWNATDGEWEKYTTLSTLRGKYVKMYTTDDDDVIGFDIFLAWE